MNPKIGAKPNIVLLGGYGNFGKRICHLLLKENCNLFIAGRSIRKASALVQAMLQHNPHATIEAVRLDWQAQNFVQTLAQVHATLVVHCAGPFQRQDYTVAKACITLGIHYIDLADARDFVSHISELDTAAKAKGSIIISGASSVPGLSSVVVDTYIDQFKHLASITCGIASGNKTERGAATIAAILGYVGKPFSRWEDAQWQTRYGWQNIHRFNYGKELGWRWHANCDIPDLKLFPERYPTVKTVAFYAGLEVSILHLTLWLMSWLVRGQIVRNWAPATKPIAAISEMFRSLGSDKGGMVVQMQGSDPQQKPHQLTWLLTAKNGHGPYIPTFPCVILIKKILSGELSAGAKPCLGLFNLKEFDELAKPWHISHYVEEG